MIIYISRFGGLNLLFHGTGSCLYSFEALPQAFASLGLSLICTQVETVKSFVHHLIVSPQAYFGPFAFLTAFVLVYRSQLAVERYQRAMHNYTMMASKLSDLAVIIRKYCKQNADSQFLCLKGTLFRWVRLYHKLSLGHFLGKSFKQIVDKENDNLCSEEEYDLLLHQSFRTELVMTWLQESFSVFAIEHNLPPPPSRVDELASDVNECFHICSNIAESPFPFVYLQIAVLLIHFWALTLPMIIAAFVGGPGVIAGILTFFSTWIFFALNAAAAKLENPFDGDTNGVPLRYYEHIFAQNMDTMEFSKTPSDWKPQQVLEPTTTLDANDLDLKSDFGNLNFSNLKSDRTIILEEDEEQVEDLTENDHNNDKLAKIQEEILQQNNPEEQSISFSCHSSSNISLRKRKVGDRNSYQDYSMFVTQNLRGDNKGKFLNFLYKVGITKPKDTHDIIRESDGSPAFIRNCKMQFVHFA